MLEKIKLLDELKRLREITDKHPSIGRVGVNVDSGLLEWLEKTVELQILIECERNLTESI